MFHIHEMRQIGKLGLFYPFPRNILVAFQNWGRQKKLAPFSELTTQI